MPSHLRRYGVLDDDERVRRPETIRRLHFDELATPGPQFRNASGVVPIENVQAGDGQVLAARGRQFASGHAIELDVLEEFPDMDAAAAPGTRGWQRSTKS